jgi:hypothetical protein
MKRLTAVVVFLMLWSANTAFATLIGTTIDVSYVNDGNADGNTSTSVVVEAGSGDAFQFGFWGTKGFTIDIEDSAISFLCTGGFCNYTPDLGPVHYIVEGLDWGGNGFLSAVTLDALSNCSLCNASVNLLSATSFELFLPHAANPAPDDTLIVNLEAIHVPEPGTLALLSLGLAGMGLARRRKRV